MQRFCKNLLIFGAVAAIAAPVSRYMIDLTPYICGLVAVMVVERAKGE